MADLVHPCFVIFFFSPLTYSEDRSGLLLIVGRTGGLSVRIGTRRVLAKSVFPDGQLGEITSAVGISGLYIGQCNSTMATRMKAAGAGILGAIGCSAAATCGYFPWSGGLEQSRGPKSNPTKTNFPAPACGGVQVSKCLRDT